MSNIWRTSWQKLWKENWQKETTNPTTALFCLNMDSSLHSQGKQESSSHLQAPAIYGTLFVNTTDLGSSAGNNTPKQPTHTLNTILCTVFRRGKRKTTCIHQKMQWIIREYLFVYNFASNYYSYTSSNWNRGGWVVYGRHCMCRELHFLGKNKLYIKDKFFYTSKYSISS